MHCVRHLFMYDVFPVTKWHEFYESNLLLRPPVLKDHLCLEITLSEFQKYDSLCNLPVLRDYLSLVATFIWYHDRTLMRGLTMFLCHSVYCGTQIFTVFQLYYNVMTSFCSVTLLHSCSFIHNMRKVHYAR